LIDDAKAAKAGCPLKYATHKKLAKALKELALFWGRSWEVLVGWCSSWEPLLCF